MGRIEDVSNPKYHLARCVVWSIIFLVFGPPFLFLALSMLDQTSVALYIEEFYITTNVSNSNLNHSLIHFNLYLGNGEDQYRVYYDDLNLTFSYNASGTVVPLGNCTIPAFHQGLGKHTERRDYVVMSDGISWQDITKNVSSSLSSSLSGVVFRVDLSGAVKFRDFVSRAKSEKRKIMAWANVEVDRNTGKKMSKDDIELKHMIVHHASGGTISAFVILILAFCFLPCWLCPLLICCRDVCKGSKPY